MSTAPLLNYSPPRPRRRWRRWAVLVCLAIVAVVAYRYRDPITRRAQLLYWQRKCLTYTQPPGTRVITTQPAAANDPDFAPPNHATPTGNPTRDALAPKCWNEFATPGKLPQLAKNWGLRSATIFLHERTSPAGHRRLVRVDGNQNNALSLPRYMQADVIEPASLWGMPKVVGQHWSYSMSSRYVEASFFFGQPDPIDPAHFTIDFEVDDRKGIIDAWLHDDDTVEFKLRDPATTRGL